MVKTVLSSLFLIIASAANVYALFVLGFGLEVKSWTCVIMFGVAIKFILLIIQNQFIKETKEL